MRRHRALFSYIFSCAFAVAWAGIPPTDPHQPDHNSLESRIATLFAGHPAVLRGHFGYKVVDAESGAVLAARDSNEFFTPASNVKLYTTGAALVQLGADYRFRTVVTAPLRKPGDTTVAELQFIGGGDPNLSGRTLPYSVSDKGGDPIHAVNLLADQIVAAHIDTVTGDVIGVDRRYIGDAYPDGWTLDDQLYDYGTPVSSLTVNDNSIHITIRPTEAGELAEIALSPEVGHFVILNQVSTVTGGGHDIRITRDPGSCELVVSGFMGTAAPPYEEDLAVANPALFAAEALLFALRQRGVSVRGSARADTLAFNPAPVNAVRKISKEAAEVVAELDSAPLAQSVAIVNKVSQNLHAEMLLRELGTVRGNGTLKSGVDARQAFLREAGVGEKDTVLTDGSGLARQNLITPNSTVTLLRYLWLRPERDVWLASFPIGGFDGSLEHRMKSTNGAERIHAKTGSISHVAALSGYVQAKTGRWLIFSIMTNAEAGPSGDVRDVIDRFCALLLEQ
jgi:D-alanyl-D-alanine carboxypeptidase/D-alanyl-D-alanine-endopeptidase (penicillin-binding protein 4)